MSEGSSANERTGRFASVWVTAALTSAAACATAFGAFLALGARDTEAFESPLMLSVARQLIQGPWGLYGPFGRQNPLVLIHAPLYYHLAALLAWPLTVTGLDPISAARYRRAVAFVRRSRGDGLQCVRDRSARSSARRAAWWAVCLIASSPVVGFMPFTVRPDMLGVAFQTTGVFLLLKAIESERPAGRAIVLAFAAFGLAICVKQHFVGGPIGGTFLLLWAWRRGRVSLRAVLLGMLLAFVIVAIFFAAEEVATEGRMSQAVFVAAAATARTHPGDWGRAAIVVSAICLGEHMLDRAAGDVGVGAACRVPGRCSAQNSDSRPRPGGIHSHHAFCAVLTPKCRRRHRVGRRSLSLPAAGDSCLRSAGPPHVLLEPNRQGFMSVCGSRGGDRRLPLPGQHRGLDQLWRAGGRVRRDIDGKVTCTRLRARRDRAPRSHRSPLYPPPRWVLC